MPYIHEDLGAWGVGSKITTAVRSLATAARVSGGAPAAPTVSASPGIAPQSSSKTLLVVAVAAVGLGAFVIISRKRRRR